MQGITLHGNFKGVQILFRDKDLKKCLVPEYHNTYQRVATKISLNYFNAILFIIGGDHLHLKATYNM